MCARRRYLVIVGTVKCGCEGVQWREERWREQRDGIPTLVL
jgi:hypothetical protein